MRITIRMPCDRRGPKTRMRLRIKFYQPSRIDNSKWSPSGTSTDT
jgi:hypothetical protein